MDDLIAFVTARLDEDEATAKSAQAPAPWKAASHESDTWIVTDATGEPLIYDEGTPSMEEAAHIARHDPARALREVAAERAVLEWHQPEWADYVDGDGIERATHQCAECEPPGTPDNWPCRTVRALAAVYSDHPGYRQEWKP